MIVFGTSGWNPSEQVDSFIGISRGKPEYIAGLSNSERSQEIRVLTLLGTRLYPNLYPLATPNDIIAFPVFRVKNNPLPDSGKRSR
jgi:hypothetical protein